MKNVFTRILACFALILFVSPTAAARENDPLKVRKYVLPNGLTVYLNEDHSRPLVYGSVAVKAGSKYEKKDATGVAHYLEHMLFKGTDVIGAVNPAGEKPIMAETYRLYDRLGATTSEEERKAIQAKINDLSIKDVRHAVPNEFSALIAEMGGTGVNAFTNNDYAAYHSFFPPQEIAKWLDINSRRFINPVFRFFQSELETVYEEKNRAADDWFRNAYAIVMARFFGDHPYGREVLGETEHVKNPSLSRMTEFFKTYYVANNMALVLCGDFESEKILPLIRAAFGRLPSGPVPETPAYRVEPFHGEELFAMSVTPLPVGVIAYRAVPVSHPDAPALRVCSHLLSNGNGTGLLDELANLNRVRTAGAFQIQYAEHGAQIVYWVPSLQGSLPEGQAKARDAVARLRRGDFGDDRLRAAALSLRKAFERNLETAAGRAEQIMNFFATGREWEVALEYPRRLDGLTRADIAKAAQKYLADDYLCFHSNVGTAPKETLAKPELKPLPAPENAASPYAAAFSKIPPGPSAPRFVDFTSDMRTTEVKTNVRLYCAENPVNDFFTLQFRYQIGSRVRRLLPFAIYYVNDLGAAGRSSLQLKFEMEKLGCSYSLSCTDNETIVGLEGYEANLEPALALLGGFLSGVTPEPARLADKIKYERAHRRGPEKRDLLPAAEAFRDYLMYRDQAPLRARPTVAEIEKAGSSGLLSEFAAVFGTEANVCYAGKKDPAALKEIILQHHAPGGRPEPRPPYFVPRPAAYGENTVFLVNRPDARQSRIYFHVRGDGHAKEDEAVVNAFNEYFAGGMSSILFQEIREFGSMAYRTSAAVIAPPVPGTECSFSAFIGCQADKTPEALRAMYGLLKNLPVKKKSFAAARDSLIRRAQNSLPDFRKLPEYVAWNRYLGYDEDPAAGLLAKYRTLDLKDVLAFYEKNFKNRPIAVCIVGDKSKFDTAALAPFGIIIELSREAAFRD